MIKAIIIDDEQHCISNLERLVHKYCPRIQLENSCSTVADGLEMIRKTHPDLIFLDVQIGENTGFDLLKSIQKIYFDIIFTTAFEQYALQAFKFSAVDYLLKPIDSDDLIAAIQKMEQKISRGETAKKIDVLMQNIHETNMLSRKIAIPSLNGIIFVPVRDIIRCEAKINYTDIFLADKRRITVSKTLKNFESLLGDQFFFRIHSAHLVNVNYVKSYHRGKGGTVILEDQTELEVSTRRKDAFLKKLSELSGV